jgi:hypothetical protein
VRVHVGRPRRERRGNGLFEHSGSPKKTPAMGPA